MGVSARNGWRLLDRVLECEPGTDAERARPRPRRALYASTEPPRDPTTRGTHVVVTNRDPVPSSVPSTVSDVPGTLSRTSSPTAATSRPEGDVCGGRTSKGEPGPSALTASPSRVRFIWVWKSSVRVGVGVLWCLAA